eukprot:6194982-Pleurochrysis_carterae.AAC.1
MTMPINERGRATAGVAVLTAAAATIAMVTAVNTTVGAAVTQRMIILPAVASGAARHWGAIANMKVAVIVT